LYNTKSHICSVRRIHNTQYTHTFCCKSSDSEDFYGYNVWCFKNEDWRKNIIKGEPEQPDKEFYHGSTPAFVSPSTVTVVTVRSFSSLAVTPWRQCRLAFYEESERVSSTVDEKFEPERLPLRGLLEVKRSPIPEEKKTELAVEATKMPEPPTVGEIQKFKTELLNKPIVPFL
jgi:hypothetical protein